VRDEYKGSECWIPEQILDPSRLECDPLRGRGLRGLRGRRPHVEDRNIAELRREGVRGFCRQARDTLGELGFQAVGWIKFAFQRAAKVVLGGGRGGGGRGGGRSGIPGSS